MVSSHFEAFARLSSILDILEHEGDQLLARVN